MKFGKKEIFAKNLQCLLRNSDPRPVKNPTPKGQIFGSKMSTPSSFSEAGDRLLWLKQADPSPKIPPLEAKNQNLKSSDFWPQGVGFLARAGAKFA